MEAKKSFMTFVLFAFWISVELRTNQPVKMKTKKESLTQPEEIAIGPTSKSEATISKGSYDGSNLHFFYKPAY